MKSMTNKNDKSGENAQKILDEKNKEILMLKNKLNEA